MKIKKKTAMLASFTVGTLLFATTALADITSKSGYEQLKDGLKVTAEKTSSQFDSYTMDISFVIKDNGKILQSENHIEKNDRKNNTTESQNINEGSNPNSSSYFYSDKNTDIRHLGNDETYYVMEYTENRELHQFNNPFKEDEAEDIERIADALIGSLKDHVIVKDNSDGSKELTGSLSEMQIPALVNAVASFQMKQEFNQRNGVQNQNMPHLTQDVFVKEVSGVASINPEGILENILGTATITGTDPQGQVHEITIEVLGKLKDINSTTVIKPDLTGKKVVKEVGNPNGPTLGNPEKYIGKYKNDIILEQKGKFVKAGERYLEITQMDEKTVTGTYHEVIKPEFKDTVTQIKDYTFKATFNDEKSMRDARFEISNESGGKTEGQVFFDGYGGKVHLNLMQRMGGPLSYDPTFSPVLE